MRGFLAWAPSLECLIFARFLVSSSMHGSGLGIRVPSPERVEVCESMIFFQPARSLVGMSPPSPETRNSKPCEVSGPYARSSSVKEAGEQESYLNASLKLCMFQNDDSSHGHESPKTDDGGRPPQGRPPPSPVKQKRNTSSPDTFEQGISHAEHPIAGRATSIPQAHELCHGPLHRNFRDEVVPRGLQRSAPPCSGSGLEVQGPASLGLGGRRLWFRSNPSSRNPIDLRGRSLAQVLSPKIRC